MKLAVSGTRNTPHARWYLLHALHESGWMFAVTAIGHGNNGTVDHAASALAEFLGLTEEAFDADWITYGKSAGPRRNGELAAWAERGLLSP